VNFKSYYIILFLTFLGCLSSVAQENEELKVTTEEVAKKKKKKKRKEKKLKPYEPLAPARAAFYSAILPGLGQIYTGKYWKVPIVYGALGAGIYFYTWNNERYVFYRDIYKRRLAGLPDIDPRTELLTQDQLIDIQRRFRREQELSILVTAGLYLLNIIDANVSAHLQQYNISDDLSLKPKVNFNQPNASTNFGLALSYSF